MQWDFDLEKLAQAQATACVFEHGGLEGLNSTGQVRTHWANVD